MEIIITKIKEVKSDFDDVYRITTENGLILDVLEKKPPIIGSSIEYFISDSPIEYNNYKEYTIMNGILFNNHESGIFVSFGGLLGNIPVDLKTKNILSDSISIFYTMKN